MLTLERWNKLSLHDQIGHIASQIKRAEIMEDKKDKQMLLKEAIRLVDLSLSDYKWQETSPLLFLKSALEEAYVGKRTASEIYSWI